MLKAGYTGFILSFCASGRPAGCPSLRPSVRLWTDLWTDDICISYQATSEDVLHVKFFFSRLKNLKFWQII